jgi:hypothetical protein
MTCFWDGIISSLNKDDLNLLGLSSPIRPMDLVIKLKQLNRKTPDIYWETKPLRVNEIEENFIHVKDFSNQYIGNGYLCSICDPFLCLLAQLLKVNIDHTYLSHTVHYSISNARKTLYYSSNRGHFWKKR